MHFSLNIVLQPLRDIFIRNFAKFLRPKYFLNHYKTHNEKTIDHAKFHTKP